MDGAQGETDCFALPPADLAAFLASPDADRRSGLPLAASSLLLRYLLPQLELERYRRHKQDAIRRALAHIPPWCHVTGSSVEGLSVPPYKTRSEEEVAADAVQDASAAAAAEPEEVACRGPFFESSDVDMMAELPFLPVELRRVRGRLFIDEARASHVGYVCVILDDAADTYGLSAPVLRLCRTVQEGGNAVHYLSNDAVKESVAAVAEAHADEHDVWVHRSGPAVNVEPRYSGRRALDVGPDIDIVPALPLTAHPPPLVAWLRRVDGASWPDAALRREIAARGRCFVVGTGHVSSTDRELEWRLSFSCPEKSLAQSLTPVQRKVYLLVKLLQKCFLKVPKVVVTYHLKTLMFWELEESQPQDWSEQHVFERVLGALDRIENCLRRQYIPSYFYPANNLISHADRDDVAKTLAIVGRIRDNPLMHLYGIDDAIWFGFSATVPLTVLHAPAREALPSCGQTPGGNREFRRRLAACLLRQARIGTGRDLLWPLRCADLVRDSHECCHSGNSNSSGGPRRPDSWSSADWLTLGAVAVFSALDRDETDWAVGVTGGGLRVQRADAGDGPFADVLRLLLPGRPDAVAILRRFCAQESPPPPPLDPMATLRYFRMRLQEASRAQERRGSWEADSSPGRSASASCDQVGSQPGPGAVGEAAGLAAGGRGAGGQGAGGQDPAAAVTKEAGAVAKVEQTAATSTETPKLGTDPVNKVTNPHKKGAEPARNSEETATRCTGPEEKIGTAPTSEPDPVAVGTGAIKKTARSGTMRSQAASERAFDGTSSCLRTSAGGRGVVSHHEQGPPEPGPEPEPVPELMRSVVLPLAREQRMAGASSGKRNTTQRLAVGMLFQGVYGSGAPLLARLHVPLLETVGALRQLGRRRLAGRCALWLHRLTKLYGGLGPDCETVVPLAAAGRFLASLPPEVAAALREGDARAAALPLHAFVVFVTQLDDEPFRRQMSLVAVDESKLALFDAAPAETEPDGGGDGGPVWTSAVLKLCLRLMMGAEVQRCLREVVSLSGPEAGRQARQILRKYRL